MVKIDKITPLILAIINKVCKFLTYGRQLSQRYIENNVKITLENTK